MEPKIIYEDNFLLVINKPAGLVVNRAETVGNRTLQDWIEKRSKIKVQSAKLNDFYSRSGIVHRLDKDTSGVMVIAKTKEAFINLQKQFKDRKVHKTYLALVHGKVSTKEGTINMPLGRSPKDRKKFAVLIGGRLASTYYKRIGVYASRKKEHPAVYSLLQVEPKTGRTHQIRVHLKHLDHPIVSDPIYLNRDRLIEDHGLCGRLFLHALKLKFFHPETAKLLEFEAALPKELSFKKLACLNET